MWSSNYSFAIISARWQDFERELKVPRITKISRIVIFICASLLTLFGIYGLLVDRDASSIAYFMSGLAFFYVGTTVGKN